MSLPQLLDPASRLAFLEARQSVVGSSDIACVCGVDKWRDPLDIYLDKTRPVEVESEANIHLLRGVLLEPVGAELYKSMTGNKVRRMGQRRHKDTPWAGVHADYQILKREDHGTGALEVKAPGAYTFNDVLENGLPDNYIAQLQWQLYVTGYDWGEFAVVNLEHQAGPLLTIPMDRDDELIKEMVERAKTFWDHVENQVPLDAIWWMNQPPLPIPEHDGARHYLDANDHPVLVRMLELDQQKKEIKKEWETQRDMAKEHLEGLGYTRTHVRGAGKINFDHRAGRRQPNEKRLFASKPLDRDLVRLAFADHEIALSDDQLTALEMDMNTVMNQGDAYRHFQCWPSKAGE